MKNKEHELLEISAHELNQRMEEPPALEESPDLEYAGNEGAGLGHLRPD